MSDSYKHTWVMQQENFWFQNHLFDIVVDTEEPLYSSRYIKIFARDYDSFHTTKMNRQGDLGK
jgi:hypothetical protein